MGRSDQGKGSAMINKQELDAKTVTGKKDGFAKFLEDPMVRMGMSMIPPGDKQEALSMLLQSAFNCGYDHGAAMVAVSMVEALLKDKK